MATINRSAKSGKFVTAKKAAKHKATTVTETVDLYQQHRKEVIALIRSVGRSDRHTVTFANIAARATKARKLLMKLNENK